MLNILIMTAITDISEYEGYTGELFDQLFNDDWFSDPFVKEMIYEVDKTIVTEGNFLVSDVLGNVSPYMLSTGVKTLMLLYYEDVKVNGGRMGNNCWPFVFEIADKKDVNLYLNWLPPFPKQFTAKIVNTGDLIHSFEEFFNFWVSERGEYPFYYGDSM